MKRGGKNSPPANPQLVSWTTTDPHVMSPLFFGDQQTPNFAVTPAAISGPGQGDNLSGRIATDYVEVTVKHRLP